MRADLAAKRNANARARVLAKLAERPRTARELTRPEAWVLRALELEGLIRCDASTYVWTLTEAGR